MKFTWKTV